MLVGALFGGILAIIVIILQCKDNVPDTSSSPIGYLFHKCKYCGEEFKTYSYTAKYQYDWHKEDFKWKNYERGRNVSLQNHEHVCQKNPLNIKYACQYCGESGHSNHSLMCHENNCDKRPKIDIKKSIELEKEFRIYSYEGLIKKSKKKLSQKLSSKDYRYWTKMLADSQEKLDNELGIITLEPIEDVPKCGETYCKDPHCVLCKTTLQVWAKEVKERDSCCINCGSIENLHAHHVLPKINFPDKAFEITNGITVCSNCHIVIHTKKRIN